MTKEKKNNSYKKPAADVIKLDKDASFMTQSVEGPWISGQAFTEEEEENE